MKKMITVIGLIFSLVAAFFLWCCIRVGSMSDYGDRDEEETRWLKERRNGGS